MILHSSNHLIGCGVIVCLLLITDINLNNNRLIKHNARTCQNLIFGGRAKWLQMYIKIYSHIHTYIIYLWRRKLKMIWWRYKYYRDECVIGNRVKPCILCSSFPCINLLSHEIEMGIMDLFSLRFHKNENDISFGRCKSALHL